MVEEMPLDPEVADELERLGLDPFEACFYGGEEYELVVTVRPERWEEAVEIAEGVGVELKRIGKALDKPGLWLKRTDGYLRPIEVRGWEHFRA